MVQCVAFNCNIRSQKGVSMFLFPKDPKFRQIWIRNLRRDRFTVTEFSKLCSKHFTADQFKIHPALAKKCGYKKLDLRADAVPTIFDIPKTEKKQRKSTAYFKRRAIEALRDNVEDDAEFEEAEVIEQSTLTDTTCRTSETSTATASHTSQSGLMVSEAIGMSNQFNVFTQTSLNHCERQSVMIQASPVTKEIGVQTDIALHNSNHLAVEFDDDDDMPTDSDHSDIEDSDIEWTFPDQDSDEGDITPETKNDMNGDTKFIVHCCQCPFYVQKVQHLLGVGEPTFLLYDALGEPYCCCCHIIQRMQSC
ncbi:THAP domain-containing protein 10-like [Saccostrea cucullata]|uniref:THAP domain-containing protein 10-like n=1 Tax=Saccostrea cuccullata TaxID=36930 RepID=UPI002ED0A8EB